MKSNLVKAAAEVIPNPKILVNMVSQRVRQLCLGLDRWSNLFLDWVTLI